MGEQLHPSCKLQVLHALLVLRACTLLTSSGHIHPRLRVKLLKIQLTSFYPFKRTLERRGDTIIVSHYRQVQCDLLALYYPYLRHLPLLPILLSHLSYMPKQNNNRYHFNCCTDRLFIFRTMVPSVI